VLTSLCTRCDQEVRYGYRDGQPGWWHREAVDHSARHGVPGPTREESQAARAEWEAANLSPTTPNDDEKEPLATTPEVHAMPVDTVGRRRFVCFPDGSVADAQLPGGARTVINAARKTGWEISASYARGAWLHSATWTPTAIVNHVQVRLRRGTQRAVATWRTKPDGTYEFKTAWAWDTTVPARRAVNSKELKELVKADPKETA